MAVSLLRRPRIPRALLLLLLLAVISPTLVHASPATYPNLLSRSSFTVNNDTGTPTVVDSSGNVITQGNATDGSGTNFDLAALIWLGFCIVIGAPMAVAGIRGWRLTTGAGIGLAAAVCTWAAVINSVDNSGLADIVLVAIILIFFVLGFILGVFEVGRLAGIVTIGVTGGLAFGFRIVLLRAGLLLAAPHLFAVNWLIVGVCGLLGGISLIWYQRYSLLFGCASIGTFLVALALDLVMARQSGISLGLRFLFDRNDSHAVFFLNNPYAPTLRTRIVLIASLGLVPILAVIQHRVFSAPFTRRPVESDEELGIDFPTEDFRSRQRQTFLASLWDGGRTTPEKANRFSV